MSARGSRRAVELFRQALPTCVRVAPTGERGLTALPASLLRATSQLCPAAPYAGLIDTDLQARAP